MAESPNVVEPGTKPRPWYQFRLRTLLVAVTLFGLLSGAIRWLFILAGVPAAVGILIAVWFAASSAFYCSLGLWHLHQWWQTQANRDKARQLEATRIKLRLEEVLESLRAAKDDHPQNHDDGQTPRP